MAIDAAIYLNLFQYGAKKSLKTPLRLTTAFQYFHFKYIQNGL